LSLGNVGRCVLESPELVAGTLNSKELYIIHQPQTHLRLILPLAAENRETTTKTRRTSNFDILLLPLVLDSTSMQPEQTSRQQQLTVDFIAVGGWSCHCYNCPVTAFSVKPSCLLYIESD